MEGFFSGVKEKFKKLGNKKNETLRRLVCLLLAGICLLVILWPLEDEDDGIFATDSSDGKASGENGDADLSDADGTMNTDLAVSEDEYAAMLEKKLESILKDVKGVGNVSVMITLKDNGERVVEKDVSGSKSQSESDSQSTSSEETVTESTDDGNTPYVSKVLEPEISGVVVSCEGGGNSETAILITEAVQALFDVPAHKIVVLEQK